MDDPQAAGGRRPRGAPPGLRMAALLLLMVAAMAGGAARADFQAGAVAYKRGDYKTAIHEWLPYAAENDPRALYNLGQMFRLGQGVDKDMTKAEQYYRRAAAAGHVGAMANLGSLYYERDPPQGTEAVYYWRQAARGGDPRSEYLLGVQYFNGDYIARDYVLAYAWLSLAAKAGVAEAQQALPTIAGYLKAAQIEEADKLAATLVVSQPPVGSTDPSKPRDIGRPDVLALGRDEAAAPAGDLSDMLGEKLFSAPPEAIRGAVPMPDFDDGPPAPAAAAPSAARAAPEPPAPVPASSPAQPSSSSSPPAQPPPRAAEPAPPALRPAPPAKQPQNAGGPGKAVVRVQFGPERTEAEAAALRDTLRGRYGALLGGTALSVELTQATARGVLAAVRTDPLADQAAANSLCAAFSARGVACHALRTVRLAVGAPVAVGTPPAPRASAVRPVQTAPQAVPVVVKDAGTPASADSDGWRVQVGAGRSEQEARMRWLRLASANKDLLDGREFLVTRADLGGKGVFYRAQVGGFDDREAATALCDALRQRQVDCFVTTGSR
ncbi:MAG: hypothetical protein GC201_17255 [Alphaproteobacteria bacterium]|nr:hypothetical protein [Alphaproteobacteria bacterium]